MPEGYQFDARSTRRIMDAVQWVERQKRAGPGNVSKQPFPLGTLRRFGVTCADPDTGIYPSPADRPNTYWIRFARLTHDLGQGKQDRTGAYLDDMPPPTQSDPDGYWYAHCYSDTSPATKTYVPEDTLVLLSWHNQRWWFSYQREEFWGRITAREGVGTGRWRYTFEEVCKSGAAYGNWTIVTAGRSGHLFNSVEEAADATAVTIPDTAVVEVHAEYYDAGGGTIATEYWCQYEEFDQTQSPYGDGGPP